MTVYSNLSVSVHSDVGKQTEFCFHTPPIIYVILFLQFTPAFTFSFPTPTPQKNYCPSDGCEN